MMAITDHILPYLGDGPLWPKIIWVEAEICKKCWWAYLLLKAILLMSNIEKDMVK